MYQSGRAGDEAKKRKSPAKSGIVGITAARRGVGLTQGSLTPKEHSLYRALKHNIRQHKLDLNFE